MLGTALAVVSEGVDDLTQMGIYLTSVPCKSKCRLSTHPAAPERAHQRGCAGLHHWVNRKILPRVQATTRAQASNKGGEFYDLIDSPFTRASCHTIDRAR